MSAHQEKTKEKAIAFGTWAEIESQLNMKIQNFGKPLCRLIITVAICMLSLNAMAYDFSYTYEGKTLYYDITSSNTVKVTYYSYNDNDYVSGAVVIPSSFVYNNTTYSVTSIGEGAFMHCSGLTSVTIPENVTSIGNDAFSSCSSLTSIIIPNSVTSIGYYAFGSCSSLTSITIPNSVASIGSGAFSSCSSLTSITIPNSVTSIGDLAFQSCSSLTSVTIGNSVTSIGSGAFSSCSSLTSVTIPESVTSIGSSVFESCSLTTLNFNAVNCGDFPYGFEHPFWYCSITTINIGDSVQRIPANFARGLYNLTSVTIGNSVTEIGKETFFDCGLTSVTIGNSVTSIDIAAFQYCSNLTSVTIPESVTSIGSWAFCGCFSLTSVTIPNSVTSIGSGAFSSCSSLTSITIGSSVASIANEAFNSCSNLTSIVSKATVPPTFGSDVFSNPNSCNVVVPCGSLEAYTSSEWNDYFPNRIEEDCSSALQEIESTREFVVYPNPAKGFVTVEFEALQERSQLRIADFGGRVVKTFDIAAGTESVRLDLRDLPSGVYTLMIGNTTKKLIIE